MKTFHRYSLVSCFTFYGVLVCFNGFSWSEPSLVVGDFSSASKEDTLPEHWSPLTFKNIERHTSYDLVQDSETAVIEAVSNGSSSGLTRKIEINPQEFPFISWKWKVSNTYQNGDVLQKSGDDYPARVYITFAYDPDKVGFWESVKFSSIKLFYGEYPPVSAINYIWASKAEKGLITPNPYTDRVKMIVIESGEEKANQWHSEKRNIVIDYKEAFGEDPPNISGVAIMTDSDNTGESATAWYGDIVFSKE
jgi:hypothetical protein